MAESKDKKNEQVAQDAPNVKKTAARKAQLPKPPVNNCSNEHNTCLIQEYVKERLEELEREEETTLNPLDRLETRARINELERLVHYMDTRVIKRLIKDIFESHKN